jgi:hypothetical protein
MDTGPMEEYDSAKDAHDSYYAAVEAKRLRGPRYAAKSRSATVVLSLVTAVKFCQPLAW